MEHIENQQKAICNKYDSIFVPAENEMKVGIALNTIDKKPLNALRHPPEKGTSGWYIWGGEEFQEDTDFFQPLHISHLEKKCPEIIEFLGLAPGWRVLIAGEHQDIWYDHKLLSTLA